ncbi:MAG: nucleotidyl transferase AbiEii/AbiGii toxin family protein [Planctomycetes bacterium]|nr:nucleotidyl transferase AbiEii/AbiGii toxin family protein [Planctomycetota bacterium]
MRSRLTPLQTDVLAAFFEREQGFYLTGGAALAGFHLGHRTTVDLDLFRLDGSLETGERALHAAAKALGGTVENIQTAPEFARRIVRRGDESVVVDLVVERVPQGWPKKQEIGRLRVDPPEEILANKLCTLLSRGEIRDLVDVMFLERAGFAVENFIAAARAKDSGLTLAQLGWVLSQISIGDDAKLPGAVSVADLRAYLASLIARLSKLSKP